VAKKLRDAGSCAPHGVPLDERFPVQTAIGRVFDARTCGPQPSAHRQEPRGRRLLSLTALWGPEGLSDKGEEGGHVWPRSEPVLQQGSGPILHLWAGAGGPTGPRAGGNVPPRPAPRPTSSQSTRATWCRGPLHTRWAAGSVPLRVPATAAGGFAWQNFSLASLLFPPALWWGGGGSSYRCPGSR
jgi:hypothetical protein